MDISPFDEGVIAAMNGGSLNDNRYAPGSAEHDDWESGFMQQSRDADNPAAPDDGAFSGP